MFSISMEHFFCEVKPPPSPPQSIDDFDNNNNNIENVLEILDRDELVYSPQCLRPELEAAFVRFCRFSRTLVLRNFEQRITSVDFKAFCGDLLVADAIQVLKSFDYNVVDAFYYLQSSDSRHAWDDGRLDKEKLRVFENYVSQYGFDSELTKLINFDYKRRDLCGKDTTKSSYIYLFDYYQSWKRTHNGSKIMENFYRSGPKEIADCIESKFKDVPIPCQYCEKADFQAGKTNKIMCKKCYEFFNLVDAVRSVSSGEAVTLAPIEFKWDCVECYEPRIPRTSKKERKPRTRSVTTADEYCWDDASIKQFLRDIRNRPSPLTIDDNNDSDSQLLEILDRDVLTYSPQQITPELEAAFVRFCRFSRTLVLRNFEQRITSVDFKAFCGDLLVADAIQVLKSFDYNVVDAFYYLQSSDSRHAWDDGRLDKEKLRVFENYVSQYGFDSGLTKLINFDYKRRDLCGKDTTKSSYIYLFDYYQSWKRTHNGSKIMEKFYRSGPKEIADCTESKFKDVPIPCQYCEKADFQAGKTNKIMCKKCYEFFNLVDAVRSVSSGEAVTLAPIEFKWDCVECYEPDVPRRSKRDRKLRTRSATTSDEYYWSGASARKFGKLISAIKKKRQRVENCRSNLF